MGHTKQAKILTDAQVEAALGQIAKSRHPRRDRVRFLLSVKAGLRAKEIAGVTWGMVCDAEGVLGEAIELTNRVSKGKRGGRVIPLHGLLREALEEHWAHETVAPRRQIIQSERGNGTSAASMANWFHQFYDELGFEGASSHSGRRTFITRLARQINLAGGSLRDVQELAGHSNLGTTQRYIGANEEAKRKVMALV